MFQRSDAMYEHVNAMVTTSLQLRQELESNRTDRDHAECVLMCKAIRQRVNALGALIDIAALDLSHLTHHTSAPVPVPPDGPPLKLTGGGA